MLTAFLTTLEQMGRIFLFLLMGFGLKRLHILPKDAGIGISRMVTMVFLPAMLIHNQMTEFNLSNVGMYGQLVLLGCLFWTLITVLSMPIAKKFSGGDSLERGVYLYGLSFPNTGAVGTPLALAILGSAGLQQFSLFLLIFTVMTYAWGVGLFLETERKNPVKRFLIHLLNPSFVSTLIGMTLGAIGAKLWLPTVVTGFVKDIGACYVPISLLLTGYTIADYPLGNIFNQPKSYLFTLLRLILIPCLVLVLAWFMGLSKFIASILVFVFAGPSGMNVVVFPASYGRDCKTGASIVLLSSLCSIITVPILFAFVQYFFV